MQLPKPIGARILVEELLGTLSIRERGKLAGLTVITNDDERPADEATMGLVLAVGTDPFLQENGIEVGKVVFFERHNGLSKYLEGKRYRTLELQHITDVLDEIPKGFKRVNEISEMEL